MSEFLNVSVNSHVPQLPGLALRGVDAVHEKLKQLQPGSNVPSVQTKSGLPLASLMEGMRQTASEALVVLPLAAEDRAFCAALLEHVPGLVATGALAAAKLCGAPEILVAAADAQAAHLQQTCAELAPEIKVTVVQADATPVLREESALLNALAGKPVRSELLEQPILQYGFEQRPTLVLDSETACWLGACLLQPATLQAKLILVQNGGGEQLIELPLGTNLEAVAQALELPLDHPFLLGGCTGFFAAGESLQENTVSYTNGYDTMRVYPKEACMADIGKQVTAQAQELSCGKCVLCREGSWQLKTIFLDITEGRGKKADFDLVPDIGALIREGAFCGFGKDMVRPAMTLMAFARPELEAHVTRKNCPAGVCTHFVDWVIDPALCTGCGDCMDVCKEDAIEGKPGFIHMIDPVMCAKCGECAKACEDGAVIAATRRIKLPKKLTKVGRFK